MAAKDIDKAYISPIDRFLFQFDTKHGKSKSQLLEIKKHQRIALLRDHPEINESEQDIWKEF